MSGINNLYQTELYLINAISQLKYEFDQGALRGYLSSMSSISSIEFIPISTASYNLQLIRNQLLSYAGSSAVNTSTINSIILLLQNLGANRATDANLLQSVSSIVGESIGNNQLYGSLLRSAGISTVNYYTTLDVAHTLSLMNEYKSTADGLRVEIEALASQLPLAVFMRDNRMREYNTAMNIYSTAVMNMSIYSQYISSQRYYSTCLTKYQSASTLKAISALQLVITYSTLFNAHWSSIQSLGGIWVDLNDPAVVLALNSQQEFVSSYGSGSQVESQEQLASITPSMLTDFSFSGGGLADVPTAVPVGSVGRMDGWWIGGTGDITHVVLDDANNNIVFMVIYFNI